MNTTHSSPLTSEHIAGFHRDGAVVVRGLFDPPMMELLAEGIDHAFKHPSRHHLEYVSEDSSGRFSYDAVMLPDSTAFQTFLKTSSLGETVGTMLNSSKAIGFYASVFARTPGTAKRTPWHQDMPFWAAWGQQTCSSWIPLEPVPKDTALEFVQGSHLWKTYARPDFSDQPQEDYLKGETQAEPFPDIDANPDGFDIISWAMEPGDCVFFHGMTAHAGSGNLPKDLGRRTVSFQWLGDDAVFNPKPGGHDPDFADELAALGLKPGDPIHCDLCPVVWQG